MLLGCFTACGNGDGAETTVADAETEAETEAQTKSEAELEYERLGNVDWGGEDFAIMSFKDFESHFYVDRDKVGAGDIMHDAIYERNSLFEDRCNLNFVSIPAEREDFTLSGVIST